MDTSKYTFVPTISKPFHTESQANTSHNKENSPAKFDTNDGLKYGKVNSNTLTVPKSPNLRTKYRSKPTTILPTEEYKIREMQNYKFKANPVDRKIFENRNFGIPTVQKPKLTEPHSPAITKSKPLRPKSPSPLHVIKANPVPDYKEPYRPVIEHRLIELPMFNLPGEEISKKKSRQTEKKIRHEKEEMKKMREFKAQPLPTGPPVCLSIRPYYSPTQPKPFSLLTDDRGEKYQREFYKKVRKEQEYEKFYAQPLPNFEPEIPRKPECPPPTEPIGFTFLTDTRMKERHIYDEHKKLREREVEEQREKKIREEEARDEEEIRQLRADLVHHAQPIRHYSPIIIKPSNKKLTRPISPMIGEKRRKYMQMLSNNYEYLDDVSKISNVKSLDPVTFEADQVLTQTEENIMNCINEDIDYKLNDSMSYV